VFGSTVRATARWESSAEPTHP